MRPDGLGSATYSVQQLIDDGALAVNDGYRAKNAELGSEGLPFARAGNVNNGFRFSGADRLSWESVEKAGSKRSRAGDVVFTSKGTVGRFAFVRNSTPEFVYSPQLCYWRVLDETLIVPRFLYYWMHGRECSLQFDAAKGSTDMADYISLRDQRRMSITLPSLDHQRAVAWVLGSLDDKIENNRRIAGTLEEIAAVLFKARFVDFVGHDDLVDSEIGPIPRGWQVGRTSDLCSLVYGKALPAKQRVPGAAAVVGSSGIVGSHNKFVFRGPGVVVGRKGTAGSVVWVPRNFFPIDTTFVARPADGIPPVYLMHALKRADFPHAVADSAVPGLNRDAAYARPILLAPKAAIDAFEAVARPCYDLRDHLLAMSERLAAIRDALLPRLISGSLRVANADAPTAEAA